MSVEGAIVEGNGKNGPIDHHVRQGQSICKHGARFRDGWRSGTGSNEKIGFPDEYGIFVRNTSVCFKRRQIPGDGIDPHLSECAGMRLGKGLACDGGSAPGIENADFRGTRAKTDAGEPES